MSLSTNFICVDLKFILIDFSSHYGYIFLFMPGGLWLDVTHIVNFILLSGKYFYVLEFLYS